MSLRESSEAQLYIRAENVGQGAVDFTALQTADKPRLFSAGFSFASGFMLLKMNC